MNVKNTLKLVAVLSLVTVIIMLPLVVLSLVARANNTHALSVTLESHPLIVMHASSIGNDELSILRNADYSSEPVVKKYDGCLPYARSMVLNSYGGYSHTSVLMHASCNQALTIVKKDKSTNDNTPNTTITVDPPTHTPDLPKDNTPKDNTPKDKNKKACNNGEGNGSEGCSPANSTHANNDENNTSPSQDKSHKS